MGCRANSGRRHSCRLGRLRGWRGWPRPAANAARSRWSRSPGQRCRPPVARPAGGITRPSRGEPLAPVPHALFVLFYQVEIRHRQLRRDRRRLARRNHPAGECRGDRLHRGCDVVGLQPTGFVPWDTLDRRQDKLHRAFAAWRQNALDTEPHRAHGSPTSASSTALRSRPRPRAMKQRRSSSCCGSRPGGRVGCPTGLSRTAARAPSLAVFVHALQSSISPWPNERTIPATALRQEVSNAN
jgi:hypothetical protein